MKEIPLTKGKVAIVDDSDYEILSEFSWHFDAHGYAGRTFGSPKSGQIRMHRQILGLTDPKVCVDHINGDRLDNRRINLRLCSNAENSRNRALPRTNKCGFKGVSMHKHIKKWRAAIKFQNKCYHLGYFETAEAAHEAYKSAAAKLHGEFANFGETRGK